MDLYRQPGRVILPYPSGCRRAETDQSIPADGIHHITSGAGPCTFYLDTCTRNTAPSRHLGDDTIPLRPLPPPPGAASHSTAAHTNLEHDCPATRTPSISGATPVAILRIPTRQRRLDWLCGADAAAVHLRSTTQVPARKQHFICASRPVSDFAQVLVREVVSEYTSKRDRGLARPRKATKTARAPYATFTFPPRLPPAAGSTTPIH